jgi:uncharacterized membrane protein
MTTARNITDRAATAVLLLLCCVLSSGCATASYRPHTEYEKQLLGHMVFGHSADVMSTYVAKNNPNLVEGNKVVQELIFDNDGEFMAFKAATIAATYLIGHRIEDPKKRQMLYKTSAMMGYGPALWNVGMMIKF